MPRISEFFGMAVYGSPLDGELGLRANRLVREWCVERRQELEAAWACAASGKEIPWILPLR
jgi:hypothetical protein